MQISWALPLALSIVSVAAIPASPIVAREPDATSPEVFESAAQIFARAPSACVPLCAGAVDIGAAACGTCGQQGPCRHYACSNGNRQVCGVKKQACYYST